MAWSTFYATPNAPIINQYIAGSGLYDLNEYFSAFDGNRTFSTYLRDTSTIGNWEGIRTLQAGSQQVYIIYSNYYNSLPLLENSVVWGGAYRMSAFSENEGYLYTITTDSKDIAVGSDDRLLLSGYTKSVDFPVTEDAYQAEKATGIIDGVENGDAYVQIVDATATQNLYGSYFGEGGHDGFSKIFSFEDGFYAMGSTSSNTSNGALITAPPYLSPYANNPSYYRGNFIAKCIATPFSSITQQSIPGLLVFLNLVDEEFFVSYNQGFVYGDYIELYTMYGQKVLTQKLSSNTQERISVAHFASGVYLAKIYCQGKVATQKIIVR